MVPLERVPVVVWVALTYLITMGVVHVTRTPCTPTAETCERKCQEFLPEYMNMSQAQIDAQKTMIEALQKEVLAWKEKAEETAAQLKIAKAATVAAAAATRQSANEGTAEKAAAGRNEKDVVDQDQPKPTECPVCPVCSKDSSKKKKGASSGACDWDSAEKLAQCEVDLQQARDATKAAQADDESDDKRIIALLTTLNGTQAKLGECTKHLVKARSDLANAPADALKAAKLRDEVVKRLAELDAQHETAVAFATAQIEEELRDCRREQEAIRNISDVFQTSNLSALISSCQDKLTKKSAKKGSKLDLCYEEIEEQKKKIADLESQAKTLGGQIKACQMQQPGRPVKPTTAAAPSQPKARQASPASTKNADAAAAAAMARAEFGSSGLDAEDFLPPEGDDEAATLKELEMELEAEQALDEEARLLPHLGHRQKKTTGKSGKASATDTAALKELASEYQGQAQAAATACEMDFANANAANERVLFDARAMAEERVAAAHQRADAAESRTTILQTQLETCEQIRTHMGITIRSLEAAVDQAEEREMIHLRDAEMTRATLMEREMEAGDLRIERDRMRFTAHEVLHEADQRHMERTMELDLLARDADLWRAKAEYLAGEVHSLRGSHAAVTHEQDMTQAKLVTERTRRLEDLRRARFEELLRSVHGHAPLAIEGDEPHRRTLRWLMTHSGRDPHMDPLAAADGVMDREWRNAAVYSTQGLLMRDLGMEVDERAAAAMGERSHTAHLEFLLEQEVGLTTSLREELARCKASVHYDFNDQLGAGYYGGNTPYPYDPWNLYAANLSRGMPASETRTQRLFGWLRPSKWGQSLRNLVPGRETSSPIPSTWEEDLETAAQRAGAGGAAVPFAPAPPGAPVPADASWSWWSPWSVLSWSRPTSTGSPWASTTPGVAVTESTRGVDPPSAVWNTASAPCEQKVNALLDAVVDAEQGLSKAYGSWLKPWTWGWPWSWRNPIQVILMRPTKAQMQYRAQLVHLKELLVLHVNQCPSLHSSVTLSFYPSAKSWSLLKPWTWLRPSTTDITERLLAAKRDERRRDKFGFLTRWILSPNRDGGPTRWKRLSRWFWRWSPHEDEGRRTHAEMARHDIEQELARQRFLAGQTRGPRSLFKPWTWWSGSAPAIAPGSDAAAGAGAVSMPQGIWQRSTLPCEERIAALEDAIVDAERALAYEQGSWFKLWTWGWPWNWRNPISFVLGRPKKAVAHYRSIRDHLRELLTQHLAACPAAAAKTRGAYGPISLQPVNVRRWYKPWSWFRSAGGFVDLGEQRLQLRREDYYRENRGWFMRWLLSHKKRKRVPRWKVLLRWLVGYSEEPKVPGKGPVVARNTGGWFGGSTSAPSLSLPAPIATTTPAAAAKPSLARRFVVSLFKLIAFAAVCAGGYFYYLKKMGLQRPGGSGSAVPQKRYVSGRVVSDAPLPVATTIFTPMTYPHAPMPTTTTSLSPPIATTHILPSSGTYDFPYSQSTGSTSSALSPPRLATQLSLPQVPSHGPGAGPSLPMGSF